MTPEDKEMLIDAGLRFVSWLRKAFPDVKAQLLENSRHTHFGDWIRETPTLFWAYVGDQDREVLMRKSADGESIFERVIAQVKAAPPAVQNEILVGFAEGHMFPRPRSQLAQELSAALGHSRIGDVF